MRTTVELPPELMRAAKARSAERGESLKSLLTRAIAAELGMPVMARRPRERVKLPLFGDPNGPKVHLTNRILEQALVDADAVAFHALIREQRPRRRRARR